MIFYRRLAAVLMISVLPLAAAAEPAPPSVVATIKPLHALAADVMQGVGTPVLLLDGTQSPHTFSLRPSAARALADADAVFWIGPGLESFLVKPLATIGKNIAAAPLIETPGLHLLPLRGDADGHTHGGHAHGKSETDPHLWLDPKNAGVLAVAMAEILARLDPARADKYRANAARALARIEALTAETAARLAPVRGRPIMLAHDSFQYFEARFSLTSAGILSLHPELAPSAKRIEGARKALRAGEVACVFAEPQLGRKIVEVVTDGTSAGAGVLDPLGAAVPEGADAYDALIRTNADAVLNCLRR